MVGAGSAMHQFCRVGRHAMIGGYSVITQDVLPFSTTSAKREVKVYGENKIGLERRGFSRGDHRRAAQGVSASVALGAQYLAGGREDSGGGRRHG